MPTFVNLPLVSYDTLTRNLRTGEATTSRDVLAFRDKRVLRASLEHAGFTVDHVGDFGPWNGVWQGERPAGLIDFDHARPAPPIFDIACSASTRRRPALSLLRSRWRC